MAFESEFIELPLEKLHHEAAVMKADGWRFIQTHAVNCEDSVDLYYSFMNDGLIRNYKVRGVTKDQPVQSVTDLFLAAFVFENEARELFGVDMRDIVLDFQGAMYAPAESEPMRFISPEQKAAREKAARAAEVKEAKESTGESLEDPSSGVDKGGFVMTPEKRARLDAKLATMSPEKVAKVEAALKAREAKSLQANAAVTTIAADVSKEPQIDEQLQNERNDVELEEKLAVMDRDKAAKVRAALACASGAAITVDAEEVAPKIAAPIDKELEAKISIMNPEKAEKVRAALLDKAANDVANKGGE